MDRKRKITYVILLAMLGCIMIAALAGCGRDTAEKGTNGDIAESGEVKESGEKTAVDPADMETWQSEEKELDWLTLEETLRPSILQITCGSYRGSGVVWKITEEEVTVVSSAHLLKNGDICEVVCYAGIFYEAEVDRVWEDCDIGFAVIPARALEEDGVELTAIVPSERKKEEMIQGEELVIYGSMDHVAGNFVKGYLIEAEREMQLEGYENAEGLLLGGILQESTPEKSAQLDGTDEEAAGADREKSLVDAGMSGSGVFDRRGRLLGILAGGDGSQGFAAVPVWKFM